VVGQAAGFAALAAISPMPLLVMAVFLGSANPRRTALLYLIGAVLMTVIMALAMLLVIRVYGLDQVRARTPRYWLRFGIGVLALASAALIVERGRRAAASPVDTARRARPRRAGGGLIGRLTATPSPRTAFIAGMLVFPPSATFIAAVQVVAVARVDVPVTASGLIVVVTLTVAAVWVPFLGYLAAPDATTRGLRALNGWLRAKGRALAVGALVVVGVLLVIDGLLGAVSR
jgi:hypothetical protein